MAYLFAALVGITALFYALAQAIRRIKETEQTIAKGESRRRAQVDRIRRAGRATLALAREMRDAKRRKAVQELACEELEERLRASNAVDRRLYVLDDRRTQNDLGWIVRVANPEYGNRVNPNLEKSALDSWKRGRRFLVWALDERKAREKVTARFHDHKGFAITEVQRQTE
ncbi:MAG TPA: hypothetical protein VGE72_02030 [Azospirillum sp.]